MASGKTYPLSIVLSTIDKSTAVIKAIDAKFGKLGKSLEGIGKKAEKIGKKMTTNLTLPIVAIGAASVKAFAGFEDQMANVATLMDATAGEMNALGKEVQELGNITPVALEELTGGLKDIISASIPAANAMNILERSAQLGVAGLGTTAQAAKLAAGAINTWGLEGAEADRIFNTLFLTQKNGITDIAQLEQGFGAVAKKIQSSGIEVDDYFASIAALTTTTLKAAGAHTQMKAAVDGLMVSNKRTSKIWRKLGVKDFEELLEKSGGVTEAFRAIAGAAGKQSGALKKLIGSSEGEAAVLALLGSQGDAALATRVDMRKEVVGLTDAEIAYNKKLATTASSLKITKNRMQTAAISIGKILAPAVEKLALKLQEASAWWENLDDDTKETIVTIAGVVAVVGPAILIFGKLAIALGAIIPVIRAVSAAMMANPIVALAVVIGLAAASIIANWDDFEDFFELMWGGITDVFEDGSDFILEKIETMMAGIKAVQDAWDDVQAHLASKQTSGEKEAEKARNRRIFAAQKASVEAAGGTFKHRLTAAQGGSSTGNTLTGRDAAALQRNALRASKGMGPEALSGSPGGAGGVSKIEIDIKNAPQGTRVKTTSDERAIDVTAGYQMGGV